MEPLWRSRLRWRMKGAWLWPAFFILTPLEAFVLTRLPFYGTEGPGSFAAGIIVAGFFNLLLVAVVTPLVARLWRRRRGDLPRVVAQDTAGARLLVAGCVAMLAGGIAHRPVIEEAERDQTAQLAAVYDYVVAQAPEYKPGLRTIDSMRVEDDIYRSCVPGPDPKRWLCLFVSTDQHPAGVRLDGDRAPNGVYRLHGGFD